MRHDKHNNKEKKKINKTYIKAKALTTNNSVFFSKSPFKTKKISFQRKEI